MATGTIQVDPSTPAVLGQPLNFIVTTDGLHGSQNPRVECFAYDPNTNDLIYGEVYGVSNGVAVFNPLGGGGSLWLTQGGPAHCIARLFYFDFHPNQVQVELARLEFDAAGS